MLVVAASKHLISKQKLNISKRALSPKLKDQEFEHVHSVQQIPEVSQSDLSKPRHQSVKPIRSRTIDSTSKLGIIRELEKVAMKNDKIDLKMFKLDRLPSTINHMTGHECSEASRKIKGVIKEARLL